MKLNKRGKTILVILIILTVFNILALVFNVYSASKYKTYLETGTFSSMFEKDDEDPAFKDTVAYSVPSQVIQLKDATSNHGYLKLAVTLVLDKESKNYKKLADNLSNYDSLIMGTVTDVFSNYTIDTLPSDRTLLTQPILTQMQDLFGSDFCIDIVFSEFVTQ